MCLCSNCHNNYFDNDCEVVEQYYGFSNSFRESINGVKLLALASGLFLSDLNSNCNVALEQLPMVLTNVLHLWFGEVDERVMKILFPCSELCSIAIERSHHASHDTKKTTLATSITCATLLIDESNKSNKAIKQ